MTPIERVKQIRSSLGLNQTEFAKELGITQTSLSMIESGHRPLSDRHIKIICSVFGANESWIVEGRGEMFTASPLQNEFMSLFNELSPKVQQHLIAIAEDLLAAEKEASQK